MPFFKKKSKPPQSLSRTLGQLGYDEQREGLPDLEFLSELSPPEGLDRYYKMERNDPIVGGLMLHLKAIMHRLKWEVKGPNADFVLQQFNNLPGGIPALLFDIANAFTFGVYVGEEIWQAYDGKIYLVDIEPRFPSTLKSITKDYVEQESSSHYAKIPYSKCLHHVFVQENRSPYGVSLLRHLYKPYYYKVSVEASESVGLDRDLTGLPKIQAPEGFNFDEADPSSPNYDPFVKATLDWAIDLVGKVRRDQQQGVVIPFGWTFDIIRGENRTSVPTSDIISRYNTEMAAGVLQNFLSLGAFATTNNANTEVHIRNFTGICDSYGIAVAQSINQGVIKKMIDYNGLSGYPEITFYPVNSEKLADLASFVGRLVNQQVITPTTTLEKELLQIADLTYDPSTEKTIQPKV